MIYLNNLQPKNNIILHNEGYAEVVLCDKFNNEVARAIIDIEDTDKIKEFSWCLDDYGYAHSSNPTKRLHQLLINYDTNINIVDHIDKNKLNNRKSNLRICTKLENNRNIGIQKNNNSGFTGVIYDDKRGLWVSSITVNYKNVYLGSYKTYKEAVKSRILGEIEYYKEYSPNKHLLDEYNDVELKPVTREPINDIIGISWKRDRDKWHAYININGKRVNLGYFSDKQDAIKARKEAEEKYFGEFTPKGE